MNKILKRIRNQIEYLAKDFVPCFRVKGMTNFIRNNSGNKGLVGAEIGVNLGYNAETMLSVLPIDKLYLIDSYIEDDLYGDGEIRQKSALKRLKRFNHKISFHFMDSKSASKLFPDFYFDIIYLDAGHGEKHIKQDIELWYPKVKIGGIFGGHDFNSQQLGVVYSVLEFIDRYGLKLYGRDIDTDWWIIKK